MSAFRPSRDEYDFSYFDRVEEFAESLTRDADENTVFRFRRNTVAIVTYNHGEMCMYFDIRRNLATIEHHPLVRCPISCFPPTACRKISSPVSWTASP